MSFSNVKSQKIKSHSEKCLLLRVAVMEKEKNKKEEQHTEPATISQEESLSSASKFNQWLFVKYDLYIHILPINLPISNPSLLVYHIWRNIVFSAAKVSFERDKSFGKIKITCAKSLPKRIRGMLDKQKHNRMLKFLMVLGKKLSISICMKS